MAAPLPLRTNDDWVRELRESDPQAIESLRAALVLSLGLGLRKYSVREQDVEDFAQETVLRVLDKLDSFRGDSKFTTWASAIGVRIALTAIRKKSWGSRSLDALTEEQALALPDDAARRPDRAASKQNLLDVLEQAIDESLTERQRKLIRGELAGMPSSVLVEELGTNTNALYKLYHDARKKLRKAILAAGFSENDVRSELGDASESSSSS